MIGQEVRLERVGVRFGDTAALHPTDLVVPAGRFFSILGPSGCGKTTILRVVAGFQGSSEGRVLIGGRDVTSLGPTARSTGMIFQTLALFPHMSVWENVAFGLEARGVGRAERRRHAEKLLDLVALSEHSEKKPGALSGGQRQRVAIARALAVEPSVLLLDEPLSALDLKLRQHMRAELKGIQQRTGITFLYITHDQGEALAMSDLVAVMSRGRIEQVGTPDELYRAPRTPFVATFVGEQNVLRGRVSRTEGGVAELDTPLGALRGVAVGPVVAGGEAELMVRPERLVAGPDVGDGIRASAIRRAFEGAYEILTFDAAGTSLVVQRMTDAQKLPEGDCRLTFRPEDALVFPAGAAA
jgi:spermidine/putrescine transport system ATP-binding protein